MADRIPVRHLTILLLKEGETESAALRDDVPHDRHDLRSDLPFSGSLYVKRARPVPPKWLQFVNEGLEDPVSVTNRSSAAVLWVEAANRAFAITFGTGRYLLRQDSFERRFGLRVVLNAVDPLKLRSLDTQVFEEMSVQTRRLTSRASGVASFGVDPVRDMLRAVTGEPSDVSVGRRLTGSDSLVVNVQCRFDQLAEKCALYLDLHEREDYKENFAWVDHIAKVTDPAVIAELDERLVSALLEGQTESTYLAPPEAIEWTDVESIRYEGTGSRVRFDDLNIEDYLHLLAESEREITLDTLKRHKAVLVASQHGGVYANRRCWPWGKVTTGPRTTTCRRLAQGTEVG